MDELARQILRDVAIDQIAPKTRKRSPVDHWAPAILLERAAYLKKMARYGDGSASETLKDYPQHAAMLLFRSRDGEAEMYEGFAHLFYVLAGTATLVTCGSLTGARRGGAGAMRGDAIEGGVRQELKAGDLVHVPAGIPHQILVADEKTVTFFAVRIQESA